MTTTTKILIGIGVLIVLCGLVVAGSFRFSDTPWTTALATTGFIVAVSKTAYDIIDKERERKKKADEGRERVKATARFGMWNSTGHELGVVIYNEGSQQINIKHVVFNHMMGGTPHQISFSNKDYRNEELLSPKDTAKFWDTNANLKPAIVATMPPESVNITIESYQGVIYRVSGEEIIKALQSPSPGLG
jgi:hypothetical protein